MIENPDQTPASKIMDEGKDEGEYGETERRKWEKAREGEEVKSHGVLHRPIRR